MVDFGYDWGTDDNENAATAPAPAAPADEEDTQRTEPMPTASAAHLLPPGIVVKRVAASDRQANPNGTTAAELLEPMVEDKAKELEVETLEHEEENLGPLEVFCQRSSSVYIYQRVWAAKEVGRLLPHEPHAVALGILVPIAMRLLEDRELFVRETMAQNILPVLEHYYQCGVDAVDAIADQLEETLSLRSSLGATIVPPISVPSDAAFGEWLHRVLLTPHTSVSLPVQRAAVMLGRRLSFDKYHTEIVHTVILGLVQNPVHQHLVRQQQRSKEMVVKSRTSQEEQEEGEEIEEILDSAPGFLFVSPSDDDARLELTRRKLLMLHMIHLVATEFGAAMRPAVFVPVVERATKDSQFEVRRDAAAVLGSLAKAVSVDLAMDVLFPCFLQLTMDAVWQVRQSAARHALPGLALVLACRAPHLLIGSGGSGGGGGSSSSVVAEVERKSSLHRFARSAMILPVEALTAEPQDDPLAPYTYSNQPSRSVPDKQWLQLVERLVGPREPSHHVRAAVFESIGKTTLALIDCPRARDALVALVVADVARAHSEPALFGSHTSLQDLDDDSEPEDTSLGPRLLPKLLPARKDAMKAGSKTQRAVSRACLYQCAFNFPALLASLGMQGWDRLRDAFMQLSKAEHHSVRQTLACSLHEVARILASVKGHSGLMSATRLAANRMSNGDHAAPAFSADLESVLCLFLIDTSEIKLGALAHLGDTLTWLTPASRIRCLPMIMQVFRHDGKQWRTREMMAAQLVKLCHLFPASTVVGSLLPMAVEWANDPVAGVRAAVAPAFPIVFELTKLDPSTQVRFFETVISFSHAASFRGRLFFIEICAALLAHDHDPDNDPVDFDQFFLPSLAALANDRVANVRIALARLVRRMLENRMRRQSISATLADIRDADEKKSSAIAKQHMRRRSSSSSGSSSRRGTATRSYAHRSVGSVARRPRRNTTPMRAHLLAMMVQQLAKDADRDVLDLVRDLPGAPPTAETNAEVAGPAEENSGTVQFPRPLPSPPLLPVDDDAEEPDHVSALSEPLD
ncbi:hypothetical protein GGI26_003862 [Coemansia sp. RSA 1358]|uniref:ARM repeat-containing protein n=1 Tax=Coemansia umbellata TaxID=1424467 RepID=A0ABQ8PLM2_9FUNG|nr:hypothetical protein EDC05_003225 [Coemansia umbellata]KAJ2621767.1 hypothetical protein GGI26_003862 [Coemansia sp. RSA 1358]